MGRIPEYNRGQLASEYVGGAQRDNSEADAAGAIQASIQPIVKNEMQKVEAKRKAEETAVANSHVVDFSLDLQTRLAQLQKDKAANPREYPAAAQTLADNLWTEYQKSIPNENVRREVESAVGVLRRSIVASSLAYVDTQSKTNATVATENAAKVIGLQAGTTITLDGLRDTYTAFDQTLHSESAKNALDAADVKKIDDTYRPGILTAHLDNRVRNDRAQLVKDIDAGLYNDIPGFDAKMKDKYLSEIETRNKAQEVIDRARRRENEERSKFELNARIASRTIREEEIDELVALNQRDPEQGITEDTGRMAKKALYSQITQSVGLVPGAKKFVKAANLAFTNTSDRVKAYEAILESFTGDRSDVEKAFLNELVGNRDKQTRTYSNEFGARMGLTLSNWIRGKKYSIEEQRDILLAYTNQIRLGMAPDKAVNKVLRDKQLAEHPALAGNAKNADRIFTPGKGFTDVIKGAE